MELRKEIIVVGGLLFFVGGFGGVVVGYNKALQELKETPVGHMATEMIHNHDFHEVTGEVPTLELAVYEDPKSGYNIQLITSNYRFAPENASTQYVDGEGHAHIYLNGRRINRMYGPWYHISEIPSGDNVIRVTLSGNDHSELTFNGEPIAREVTVSVE